MGIIGKKWFNRKKEDIAEVAKKHSQQAKEIEKKFDQLDALRDKMILATGLK